MLKRTKNLKNFILLKQIFMKGLSREEVSNIKQRRRTLKNRGYAATVRVKREETKGELETKLNFVDTEEKKYRSLYYTFPVYFDFLIINLLSEWKYLSSDQILKE